MITETTWHNVDLDTLAGPVRRAYEEYKVAQRAAAALRASFEDACRTANPAPAGQRLVFGYKFGKLSVAMVADEGKPAKAKQASGSLADFLAAQAAAGRAA